MAELIDRQAALSRITALIKRITPIEKSRDMFYHDSGINGAITGAILEVKKLPAVDAVEVSADELKYLINDTIAYIWRMEDSGRDKSEFGYDERKALLEKLKRFKEEHFPEMRCCVERREENAAD